MSESTNNLEALTRPMMDEEVNWRMDSLMKNGTRVRLLAYIDARAAMERLDEAVGHGGWSDDYMPGPNGGVMCRLKLSVDSYWVSKSDVAENTQIEAVKGGVSDAFKRACVKWGIGRNLYDLGDTIVDVVTSYPKGVSKKYIVRVNSKRDNVRGWAVAPSIRDILGIHTDSGAPKFEPVVANGTPVPAEPTIKSVTKDPIVKEVVEQLDAQVVDVVPAKKGRVSKEDMLAVIGNIMRGHNLDKHTVPDFVEAITTGNTRSAMDLKAMKWTQINGAFKLAKELATPQAWSDYNNDMSARA
tara:strand:+ start:322 stop:1218 length:897 start_codon:yes stop_codon:yes gene_type:complete